MINLTVFLAYLLAPATFFTLLSGLLAVTCAVTILPGTNRSTLGLPLTLHMWLRPPAALTALALIGLAAYEGGTHGFANAMGSTMICFFAGAYISANGHRLTTVIIGPPPRGDDDGPDSDNGSLPDNLSDEEECDDPPKLKKLVARLKAAHANTHLANDKKNRAIKDLNKKITKLRTKLAEARNQPTYKIEAHGSEAVHAAAQGPAWTALTNVFKAVTTGTLTRLPAQPRNTSRAATPSNSNNNANYTSTSRAPSAPQREAAPPPMAPAAPPPARPSAPAKPRPSIPSQHIPAQPNPAPASPQPDSWWTCFHCTTPNDAIADICRACQEGHNTPSPAEFITDVNRESTEAINAIKRAGSPGPLAATAMVILRSLPFNLPPTGTAKDLATFTPANVSGHMNQCCIYTILYILRLAMNNFNANAMVRALSLVNDSLIGFFRDKETNTIFKHKRDAWRKLTTGITDRPIEFEDLLSARAALGDMIRDGSSGLDHGITLFLTCVLFTNIPIAIACCVMKVDGTHHTEYYVTISTHESQPNYIRGSVAFIPFSSSRFDSCQPGTVGHYWGATTGWTFNKKHHPSIVERILYAFGASPTPPFAGRAKNIVLKATNSGGKSFLKNFTAAAAEPTPSPSHNLLVDVDLSGLPEEGAKPAATASAASTESTTTNVNKSNIVNNLAATAIKSVAIAEGSTPPKEALARAASEAAASSAATTAAGADAATAAAASAAGDVDAADDATTSAATATPAAAESTAPTPSAPPTPAPPSSRTGSRPGSRGRMASTTITATGQAAPTTGLNLRSGSRTPSRPSRFSQ